MEYTPTQDHVWFDAPVANFTGEVRFSHMSHKTEERLNVLGVHFEPGARTDWHTHPEGQVLYVVGGEGLVQTADGETVEITAGDVVYSPPGELHWHGAQPTSPMMHLSLTTGGATEWQPRKVTDQEYHRRAPETS
ncbi:MAG: cupin domain-containing protein [Acidimicrobiia bacterium]|nr:cupin domain-containing protein [Acidimicrobiia bacterium]